MRHFPEERPKEKELNSCLRVRILQAESSAYAVHSSPDLPPSYASVMTVQGTSRSTQMLTTINPSSEDKFENPPPYSIVIASINAAQEQNVEMSRERHVPSVSTKKNEVAVLTSTLASVSQTYPQPR